MPLQITLDWIFKMRRRGNILARWLYSFIPSIQSICDENKSQVRTYKSNIYKSHLSNVFGISSKFFHFQFHFLCRRLNMCKCMCVFFSLSFSRSFLMDVNIPPLIWCFDAVCVFGFVLWTHLNVFFSLRLSSTMHVCLCIG